MVRDPNMSAENKQGHKDFAGYNLPSWVQHPLKKKISKVAILFPGEQNHGVGMLRDAKRKPAVKEMLAKASDVLNFDMLELMTRGPKDKMVPTGVNQPLMFVANCAAYEVMKLRYADVVENPQAVAGFSVGELNALYAAGVISFEQGLQLVKMRAQVLQDLAETTEMAVLQISGLEVDKVEKLCTAAGKQDAAGKVYIAAHLCQDTVLCAGKKSTIVKLQELESREFKRANEVTLLGHNHAGHTPMVEEAAEKFNEMIDRMLPAMKPPRCEIFLNSSGLRVPPGTHPADFADVLKANLVNPVLWETTIINMMSWGVQNFYECGPSRSLRNLMANIEYLHEAGPCEVQKPSMATTSISV
eukprot:gnl/TRDRNA2_/TRDRNA2_190848_c0_seq1.p1 gnl/TRDRNA2_/TRDRNA2_190848_c0~~gnl/TRDRNA2_/TRDRNA2_190848_c0_seq1.p1  ORF type:complete len:378 (+),score=87.84 gnl/TRDRNA2_/TRDRNA2_190848_c0_seq1:62-1135(+)